MKESARGEEGRGCLTNTPVSLELRGVVWPLRRVTEGREGGECGEQELHLAKGRAGSFCLQGSLIVSATKANARQLLFLRQGDAVILAFTSAPRRNVYCKKGVGGR